jgi:hypothetical protein
MKIISGLAVALTALVLSACGGGGGGGEPVMVAASDTTLAASPTTTSGVSGTPFTFSSGVTEFGTTAPTTLTFSDNTADATKPLFSISTSSGTATGTTTFGSCHFAVTAITGTVGTMHVGDVITVNPCNINVNTAGATANGVGTSRSVALVLGQAASTGATITVSVNPGGQLTLNGKAVGTVTLKPVTG